jgi:hypothetical protein
MHNLKGGDGGVPEQALKGLYISKSLSQKEEKSLSALVVWDIGTPSLLIWVLFHWRSARIGVYRMGEVGITRVELCGLTGIPLPHDGASGMGPSLTSILVI